MPPVRPVKIFDVDPAVAVVVAPPGEAVSVYCVIALDPASTGAVQVTLAWVVPPVAATFCGAEGAPGVVLGVAAFEAADAAPVPTELVAVTVNVYVAPLVRPFTMTLVAPVVVTVCTVASCADAEVTV